MQTHLTLSDLRGLSRLAFDHAGQVTDVVEEMHATIAAPYSALPPAAAGRAGGIAGLVYRSVHAGLWLAGTGVDAALAGAAALRGRDAFAAPSTPEREAMLAVLNGVLGDHLAATHNPLAIEMSFRAGGRPLSLRNLREPSCSSVDGTVHEPPAYGGGGGARRFTKMLVFVHGLCGNDLGWATAHDYGEALRRDLGYTPIYLHYNSGLHISTNGARFAALLEELMGAWPQPVEELVIAGHSMGGLVTRSAVRYAAEAGYAWPGRLRALIFLGAPHHGAPLERIGNFASGLLAAMPVTAPFRRFGKYRSAGITDLRYGNVVDEDWQGLDRFAPNEDGRRGVPLPEEVACYAIAGMLGDAAGGLKGRLLGDGLVPLASALGIHDDPQCCLAFPESHQWVAYGTGHVALLDSGEVYGKIREWLG